jgi:signal peptidase II
MFGGFSFMNRKYIILISFSLILIALDQLTKMMILTRFQLGESITVIPGFFNITYVRNFGAAFGFLAESHPSFREVFFLIMPPVAMLVIVMMLKSVRDNDYWQIFALSSVFGGAIGNYIDRLRFRYVVDFLDFHIQEKYTWPAFNIADSAIVCGVIILIGQMFFESEFYKKLAKKT